ncbi:hypothetical protein DL767_003397 [Monosporascus sp. MG133]|nr:hypothetical protein DL767_003397 [Monosporascus sp. MG133]
MGAGIAEYYRDDRLRSKNTARTHLDSTRLNGEKMGQRRPGERRRHGYGDSVKELEQPLLLAGKILEAAGLPWLSDFFIEDVFDEAYPGLENRAAPRWLDDTRREIGNEFARSLEWQLDGAMFRERGWVGYTCRHPRGEMELDDLDTFETIARYDARKEGRYRTMSILVMAEFPARLRDLREQGREEGEEYLLTAFMTAVTLLHELGHAAYWKDRGSLTTDLREPFYGADLEMELGDSFIASLFGGWIPVPIKDLRRPGRALGFDSGIAWRQSLSWEYHRIRPKYRAHYSISVDYVAQLFRDKSWSSGSDLLNLIRPQYIAGDSPASRTVGLLPSLAHEREHATAALADFHPCGEGWVWNRRSRARFRIPQYDGYLCPGIDLPLATDDVVGEPMPCPPQSRTPVGETRNQDQVPSPGKAGAGSKAPIKPAGQKNRPQLRNWAKDNGLAMEQLPEEAPKLRFGQSGGDETLSVERCEISLDDLKKRLSQLIDVSLNELEKLFETPRCG